MNTFIKSPYVKYCLVMFPYGTYRQWNTQLEAPYDLLGHRILSSTINGVYYISPFGVTKIFNLFNRLDIKYHNLDKDKYKGSYEEIVGYNYNTF